MEFVRGWGVMTVNRRFASQLYLQASNVFVRTILLLFALLAAEFVLAEPVITLQQVMQGVHASSSVFYLEDPAKKFTFDQVRREPLTSAFQPLPDGNSNFSLSASDFWLRLDVINNDSDSLTWMLEAPYPQWDHVTFYSDGEKLFQGGDHHPFALRPIASESNVYKFTTTAASRQRIWIHFSYDLSGLAETQLRLWTPDAFNQYYANRYLLIGAIVGIAVLLVFYNLFIGYSTRMVEFIWYTSYVLTAVFSLLSITGLGYRYFWSESPWFADFAPILFLTLMLMLATQFTRSFLATASQSLRIDRVLKSVFVLGALALLCYFAGWRDYAVLLVLMSACVSVFFSICRHVAISEGQG